MSYIMDPQEIQEKPYDADKFNIGIENLKRLNIILYKIHEDSLSAIKDSSYFFDWNHTLYRLYLEIESRLEKEQIKEIETLLKNINTELKKLNNFSKNQSEYQEIKFDPSILISSLNKVELLIRRHIKNILWPEKEDDPHKALK